MLNELPEDCIFVILCFFHEQELYDIFSVSKSLSNVARSDRLWKGKFENRLEDLGTEARNVITRLIEGETFYLKFLSLRVQERIYRVRNQTLIGEAEGSNNPYPKFHTTIIGDDGIGKSSLAKSFRSGLYVDYVFDVPDKKVFEEYDEVVLYESHHCYVRVCDSRNDTENGKSFFDLECSKNTIRNSTAIMLCFSLMDPPTLESVKSKWYPKLSRFCPSVPIILCGLKLDLKQDIHMFWNKEEGRMDYRGWEGVSGKVETEEGERMAREINAFAYFETSAKTQKGMKEVFNKVVEASFWNKMPKQAKEREKRAKKISSDFQRRKKLQKKKQRRKKTGKGGCWIM